MNRPGALSHFAKLVPRARTDLVRCETSAEIPGENRPAIQGNVDASLFITLFRLRTVKNGSSESERLQQADRGPAGTCEDRLASICLRQRIRLSMGLVMQNGLCNTNTLLKGVQACLDRRWELQQVADCALSVFSDLGRKKAASLPLAAYRASGATFYT